MGTLSWRLWTRAGREVLGLTGGVSYATDTGVTLALDALVGGFPAGTLTGAPYRECADGARFVSWNGRYAVTGGPVVDAGAATTVVYSIAPDSSRRPTSSATVDPVWPMAT